MILLALSAAMFVCALLPAAAQTLETPPAASPAEEQPLETGWLLFIPGPRRCDVYVDAEYRGVTPILLTDLKEGPHFLEIRNAEKLKRTEILVRASSAVVTTYEPVLGPYTGSLALNTEPPGIEISLNGENVGTTPLSLPALRTGTYTVSVRRDGFLPVDEEIEVVWDKETAVELPLTPAYRLSLEPAPPADASIEARDAEGNVFGGRGFTPAETLILPVGSWDVSVQGSTFNPLTKKVVISDSDITLVFDPDLHHGELLFSPGLNRRWVVLLDDTEITGDIVDGKIAVAAGEHSLTVTTPGFLPYTLEFRIDKDQVISISPALEKDPRYVRDMKRRIGIPIVVSGLILSAGGLVFNLDSVAIGLTDTYADYTLVKYSTLGVLGAGLLFSAAGSLLVTGK